MDEVGLYIDGAQVPAGSGESFVTTNPATRQSIATVAHADTSDVDRAVASARHGFAEWSARTGAERGRVLLRAAAILRERNDELAHLEVVDTGKPIAEASTVDVISGAECIEYFAGAAATIHGEYYDLGGPFAYTRREPLGVCVGIGAWNYPIQIACWKSAPALACGNAMVFKPSDLTPLSAMKLAEIYTEAGIPAGVFNVVQGDRRTGDALVHHPDVAKVSLTGSVPTGKAIMAAAAETLKIVTLELGGKSPLVVFEDADVEQAVSAAMLANFYTQGEICSNGTRVFVHRQVHDAFVDALRTRTERMTIGDPLDPTTDVGALISEAHMNKVLGYVDAGVEAGA
ncbi:MAG: aldehyde dehydrogenase family protein, partial [Acidimicrobiia bacterium]